MTSIRVATLGLTHGSNNIVRHLNNAAARKATVTHVAPTPANACVERGRHIVLQSRMGVSINFSSETEAGVILGITQLPQGSFVAVTRSSRDPSDYRMELHSLWHMGWLNDCICISESCCSDGESLLPHYHDTPRPSQDYRLVDSDKVVYVDSDFDGDVITGYAHGEMAQLVALTPPNLHRDHTGVHVRPMQSDSSVTLSDVVRDANERFDSVKDDCYDHRKLTIAGVATADVIELIAPGILTSASASHLLSEMTTGTCEVGEITEDMLLAPPSKGYASQLIDGDSNRIPDELELLYPHVFDVIEVVPDKD